MVDLETSMSFTGNVAQIPTSRVLSRDVSTVSNGQIVETLVWAAMSGTN